jgi:hypothetical protein
MLRVLGAFGLTAPNTAPAQLLRALGLERHVSSYGYRFVWDGPDAVIQGLKLSKAMLQLSKAGHAVAQVASMGLVGVSLCGTEHQSTCYILTSELV